MLDEDDGNTLDEVAPAEKTVYLTPKDLDKPKSHVQMKIDRGDSFDDMLDEDDEDMFHSAAGTTKQICSVYSDDRDLYRITFTNISPLNQPTHAIHLA